MPLPVGEREFEHRSAGSFASVRSNSLASPSITRAFVYGYYGRGNFGDEALRSILADMLRESGLSSRFSEPRRLATGKSGWLSSFAINARRTWDEWICTDVVILGGGGLLKDSSIVGGLSLSLSLIPVWTQLLLGRPLLIVGVGAGPIRDAAMNPWIQLLCRLASGVYVRDPMSAEVLLSRGVAPATVEVRADLFFAGTFEPVGALPVERDLSVIALSDADLYWYCQENGLDTADALTRIADLVLESVEPSGSIVFARLSSGDEAFEFGSSLEFALAARGLSAETIDCSASDADRLVAVMKRAREVVASRYHAVAAGAVGGTRLLVIPFDRKCANLAHQLGVEGAILEPDELFAEAKDAGTSPIAVRPLLPSGQAVANLTRSAHEMVNDVKAMITDPGNLRRVSGGERLQVLRALGSAAIWGAKRRLRFVRE